MEITVAVLKPATRERVLSGWKDLQANLDHIPPAMAAIKDVIRGIQLGKSGDSIRAAVKVSEAQLDSIASQFGSLLPGSP